MDVVVVERGTIKPCDKLRTRVTSRVRARCSPTIPSKVEPTHRGCGARHVMGHMIPRAIVRGPFHLNRAHCGRAARSNTGTSRVPQIGRAV
jgi:hypothetical protein